MNRSLWQNTIRFGLFYSWAVHYQKIFHFGTSTFTTTYQSKNLLSESNFDENCVSVYKYPTSICKQLWLYCWKSLKAVQLLSIITTFKPYQLFPKQRFQLLANWQLYNSIISFEWTRFRNRQTTAAAAFRFNNVLFSGTFGCSHLVVTACCQRCLPRKLRQ